jgi:hypothetical protein
VADRNCIPIAIYGTGAYYLAVNCGVNRHSYFSGDI